VLTNNCALQWGENPKFEPSGKKSVNPSGAKKEVAVTFEKNVKDRPKKGDCVV